jgi:16S rRNA (guanine527-N7)-methyltransferase
MIEALKDESIVASLGRYGFSPDPMTCHRIRAYVHLLLRWNERVSLTTVTNPEEMVRFHFGESIYAVASGVVKDGRLADVGSGGGFPGIPLSLIRKNLEVTLIEPNLKKSVFLLEVKRELKLENVNVARTRMEVFEGGSFDLVTSRALGKFDELLTFAEARLKPSGKAVLWLGLDDADELISRKNRWNWERPRPIPYSKKRCILAGSVPETVSRETK